MSLPLLPPLYLPSSLPRLVPVFQPWLATFLRARGVDLVAVEMIPDSFEDIADSLLRLRSKVSDDGFVFTSGGIGPTHDDITYEAIAKALGLRIELHAETHERMKAGIELRPPTSERWHALTLSLALPASFARCTTKSGVLS